MATKKKATKELFVAVANGAILDQECGDNLDLTCFAGTLAEAVETARHDIENPIDGEDGSVSVVIYKLVPVKTVKRAAILVEDV